MKHKIDTWIREIHEQSEDGRAYLAYNEKVGGPPIGLFRPFGYPDGVEAMGGPSAVYAECIAQGRTWEDLLNYERTPEGADS